MKKHSNSEDLAQAHRLFLGAIRARTPDVLRETFDLLVPLLQDRLVRIALGAQRRHRHETSPPDQVAQTVWFRLFKKLVLALSADAIAFREPPNEFVLLGLLRRIATNDVLDRKRRSERRRELRHDSIFNTHNPLSDSSFDPMSQADRKDVKDLVWLAIQGLSADDRFIAVERIIECRSWEAIGSAIGATADTTRMRWNRIKNELAVRMCGIRHSGPWDSAIVMRRA